MLAVTAERFLTRVFTAAEAGYWRGRPAELAARFAGEEAILKPLGTGRRGFGRRAVEILADGRGKPLVRVHGRALERAHLLGLGCFAISLSHTRDFAVASVVATRS